MQHWYVYYKLPRGERDALLQRVRRLQEQVAQSMKVRVRLLERTDRDDAGDVTTVMEVYEDIEDAGGFAAKLDAAVRAQLPAQHVSARRVERFQDA